MLELPGHGLCEPGDSLDGVEQRAVPVILENSPAAFHGVVFAVVRRVVGKAHIDLVLASSEISSWLSERLACSRVRWISSKMASVSGIFFLPGSSALASDNTQAR